MIGQYLLQTNDNATVMKSKKFSHLNKAYDYINGDVEDEYTLRDNIAEVGPDLLAWIPHHHQF